MVLSDLTFDHLFNEIAPPLQFYSQSFPFQKWPKTDVGPVEVLLIIFAYEKCTGETVSIDDMREGCLGPKLQDCDFDTTMQVKLLMHHVHLSK